MFEDIFNTIWKVGLEKDALLLQCGLQCSARVTLQSQLMNNEEPPLLTSFWPFWFSFVQVKPTNSDPVN